MKYKKPQPNPAMPDWSPRPPEEAGWYWCREAVSKRAAVLHSSEEMFQRADEYGPRIPTPTALGALREIAEADRWRWDSDGGDRFCGGCGVGFNLRCLPTCPYARLRGEGE